MQVIDILDEDYALVETESGKRYIGKESYWFDIETHADVRYTGQVHSMELARQRVLALRILDSSSTAEQ